MEFCWFTKSRPKCTTFFRAGGTLVPPVGVPKKTLVCYFFIYFFLNYIYNQPQLRTSKKLRQSDASSSENLRHRPKKCVKKGHLTQKKTWWLGFLYRLTGNRLKERHTVLKLGLSTGFFTDRSLRRNSVNGKNKFTDFEIFFTDFQKSSLFMYIHAEKLLRSAGVFFLRIVFLRIVRKFGVSIRKFFSAIYGIP